MSSVIVSKLLFTVTFPSRGLTKEHIPFARLQLLAAEQLSDLDVIETIDHLFGCHRCFENYRIIRRFYRQTEAQSTKHLH